jgi:ADP-ribosyl-[dinitrogen reductase] hydrolase
MGGTIYRRKLSNDLEDIRRWGAYSIVTLLERHEFGRLGVSGLGKAIDALAINWYQMPIPDMQAPAEEFEDAWASYAPILRSQLQAGERILIHCRQGRGRTGAVAARLLVDSGVGPADAITKVRSVAPACISAPVQEAYILGLKSGSGL